MPSESATFDILMVTDCRFPGGNSSSVVEEIRAQARAGYRTGLLHLPSPVLGKPRPFAKKIRDVLDEGLAELVVGARRVDAKLLLARHPSVFTAPPAGLPELRVDEAVLAVNQVPTDERGEQPYYDVPQVHRQIERLIGKQATWAPIGPRVREALADYRTSIPMLEWDWENIIDVAQWQVDRDGFVADRPVIGRHSRGHWTKWPDDPAKIRAAYPDDPRYSVHVLGGAEAPAKVLGGLPSNWVDHPFNSIPAQDFLADIDFFVYFHHPGLIEAFGRVVLEALSAGAVAIVPRYLEPLFGDACLYGEPEDVRGYVDELYQDWAAFAERSRAGVDLARRRFSYEAHVKRLTGLIGAPSAAPVRSGTPAVVEEHRRGSLVLDVTGVAGSGQLLSEVVKPLVERGDPCAVAVRAECAAEVAAALGSGILLETFPRALAGLSQSQRRQYLTDRVAGLVRAHRPRTVVLLDDGLDDAATVVASVGDPGLRVVRVHRGSAEAGDDPTGATDMVGVPLPDGWVASSPQPTPVDPAPAHATTTRRRRELPPALRLRTRARRKARTLRREHLFRMIGKAPDLGLMLFEAEEAELSLPVTSRATHPEPQRLPVVLVVATDENAAESGIRALVEREQMTSTFRVAVLAPPSWEPEAARYGVTIETLVPESAWSAAYRSGWPQYLRTRLREACDVLQPETVVHAAGPIDGAQLEVLEAARTRRRMEPRVRKQ